MLKTQTKQLMYPNKMVIKIRVPRSKKRRIMKKKYRSGIVSLGYWFKSSTDSKWEWIEKVFQVKSSKTGWITLTEPFPKKDEDKDKISYLSSQMLVK